MDAVEVDQSGQTPVANPIDECYADDGGTCLKARFPSMDEIWQNDMPGYALHQMQITTGGIMLMHDIHQNTLDELPAIIACCDGVTSN